MEQLFEWGLWIFENGRNMNGAGAMKFSNSTGSFVFGCEISALKYDLMADHNEANVTY